LSGLPQEQRRRTVTEHLKALRRVLMISTGTWILATIVAFTFNGRVLDLLERPIKNARALQTLQDCS